MKRFVTPLAVVLVVAVADQLSKRWALGNLIEGRPLAIIDDLLMFTLVYNEGGAMGTNLGSPWIYLVLAILILPLLAYYMIRHSEQMRMTVPLALIAGGAIGNVADRIRLGRVVDFIDVDIPDVHLFGYHLERWWTFNIADAAISCGILVLVILSFMSAQQAPPPPSDQLDFGSRV